MNQPVQISWYDSENNRTYTLPIYTCYLVENPCFKQATQIIDGVNFSGDRIEVAHAINGIVVHSTAAPNTSLSRYVKAFNTEAYSENNKYGNNSYNQLKSVLGESSDNHWNKDWGSSTVCVHAFLGRLQSGQIAVINTLPYNFACWGCGLENPYNSFNYLPIGRIQFEICEDDQTDEQYCKDTFTSSAMYCAYLCYRLGIDITEHYYATLYKDGQIIDPMYNQDVTAKSSIREKVPTICSHGESATLGLGDAHADPSHWWNKFGLTMDAFRDKVEQIYSDNATTFTYNSNPISESTLFGNIYSISNYLNTPYNNYSAPATVVDENFYAYTSYINYKDNWTYLVGLPNNTMNPSTWKIQTSSQNAVGQVKLNLTTDQLKVIYNCCIKYNVPYEMAIAIFLSETGAEWGRGLVDGYYGIGCFYYGFKNELYNKYHIWIDSSPEADVEVCIAEMGDKIKDFKTLSQNKTINIQELSGQYCNNFTLPDYYVWAYQSWQAGPGGERNLVEHDEYLYPGPFVNAMDYNNRVIYYNTAINARKIGLLWAGLANIPKPNKSL